MQDEMPKFMRSRETGPPIATLQRLINAVLELDDRPLSVRKTLKATHHLIFLDVKLVSFNGVVKHLFKDRHHRDPTIKIEIKIEADLFGNRLKFACSTWCHNTIVMTRDLGTVGINHGCCPS